MCLTLRTGGVVHEAPMAPSFRVPFACHVINVLVPSDDDTASQGKGDGLLESLGKSLHPDPMKVRRMTGQIIGRMVGLVTQKALNSLLLRTILSVYIIFVTMVPV